MNKKMPCNKQTETHLVWISFFLALSSFNHTNYREKKLRGFFCISILVVFRFACSFVRIFFCANKKQQPFHIIHNTVLHCHTELHNIAVYLATSLAISVLVCGHICVRYGGKGRKRMQNGKQWQNMPSWLAILSCSVGTHMNNTFEYAPISQHTQNLH